MQRYYIPYRSPPPQNKLRTHASATSLLSTAIAPGSTGTVRTKTI